MRSFNSGREAKEYLVSEIVREAERDGVPLTEVERKMMYFSETAWTLPDMQAVNEEFDREYDLATYEKKIATLAPTARAHLAKLGDGESWDAAVQTLRSEDHYLLVLLGRSAEDEASILADRLKLIGTALLICIALVVGIYFFSAR